MTAPHHQLSHPKYRPDIDGLRAVAVLSVVLFHAFPNWLKGGFVGVDVFFVISGFLISTIIFENLSKETFSFSEFYARRVKRIFPALILVLFSSYVFGWFVLFSDEYQQLGKHIVAGAGFISNIALWREAGYFDASAETKPLLHLWSLGIEEQFYIVWPLLLWVIWKPTRNLFWITAALAAASFTLNVFGIRSNAVATFYSPLTRFWELLCGSLLAWLALHPKTGYLDNAATRNLRSFGGLALLLGAFLLINRGSGFPGAWALMPVLGAALLISAGPSAWINRNILANRAAVWFGLISFPLYLWHWPLLSFARVIDGHIPSWQIRVIAVALAVSFAWLTYKLVERPIRLGAQGGQKTRVLVVLMVGMACVGFATHKKDGLAFREVVRLNTALASGNDGGEGPYIVSDCGEGSSDLKKVLPVCASDMRGGVKYALMGDSKAHALWPGLIRTSTQAGRWLFIGGNGGSAPVPLLSKDPAFAKFQPATTLAVDAIKRNHAVEVVVIAASVRLMFQLDDGVMGGNLATYNYRYMSELTKTHNYSAVLAGLDQTVSEFIDAGKRVVLVVDNPALPNPQDCIIRKTPLNWVNKTLTGKNEDCYVPLKTHLGQTEVYRQLLSEVQARHPERVEIFDPTDLLCEIGSGICGPARDGRVLYAYTDHISDYAAGRIGARLNEFLQRQPSAANRINPALGALAGN